MCCCYWIWDLCWRFLLHSVWISIQRQHWEKCLLNIDRFTYLYGETNREPSSDHVYLFYDTMPLPTGNDYVGLSLSFSLSSPWYFDHGSLNLKKCEISLMYGSCDTEQFGVIIDQNVEGNLLAEGAEINRPCIHFEPLHLRSTTVIKSLWKKQKLFCSISA